MTTNNDRSNVISLDADGEVERFAPQQITTRWVSDQMIEGGVEALLLVKDDGEVIGSLQRLGVDLWRASACKSVRRFAAVPGVATGEANAKAFVLRRLKEENPSCEFVEQQPAVAVE